MLRVQYMAIPATFWAWVVMGKAGSSTIKQIIADCYGIDTDKGDIHDLTRHLKSQKKPFRRRMFIIIRNPYSKVASFYKDKIATNKQTKTTRFYGVNKDNIGSVTFEEFVLEYLDKGYRQDIHLLPQAEVVDQVEPEKILMFEQFPDNLKKFLSKIYGQKIEIPHLHSNGNDNYYKYYNLPTAAKVYRLYEEDFKRFGYARL